ncbi:MAG TPA: hypothetical protein VFV38_17025 [Ktedonobacteraceae bacterium]|nr:hypothetical protein [Ktedonobacteraceae bacterium]
MNEREHIRSCDFLGGQQAPRASDGIGIKLLYRCTSCQRIWLQDGSRIHLDLGEDQVVALAREVSADLAALPACTCRLCLSRTGGGAIEVDEYGKGAGYGFSWECPAPQATHAIVTMLSCSWLSRQTDPRATLPDVVTRPKTMRAVLAWFVELLPPPHLSMLDPGLLQLLMHANPPGFGQPGTEHWRWMGGMGVVPCPPLGGPAQILLAQALPVTKQPGLAQLFSTAQALAVLTLHGSVAGEARQTPPEQGRDHD